MKNLLITIAATTAAIYAFETIHRQKAEIKKLNERLERVGRFSDLYYGTLSDTVRKLDGEERRAIVHKFNNDVDFIRIVNQL